VLVASKVWFWRHHLVLLLVVLLVLVLVLVEVEVDVTMHTFTYEESVHLYDGRPLQYCTGSRVPAT
jgi:hypothetical protein